MRQIPARALAALVSLGWLSSCATVSVAPGHGAVVMAPDGTLAAFGEGVAGVPSSSRVDDFDLRQQVQGGSFTARTADGVPLSVGDPSISYQLIAAELVDADRRLGPERWRALVAPVVQATLAAVLASYRWDQLDSAHIREVEARVVALAGARLRPYHLALASVDLKRLQPRLPGLARAVTATSVWEQRSVEAALEVDVARQRAESLRTAAAGLASAYQRVAPTLSGAVLQEQRDQAWRQLLSSPRTTVEIANDSSPTLEVKP